MSPTEGLARFAEIEQFASAIRRFRAGDIPPSRFQEMRLQFGVYSQRDPDVFMVRARIPGGRINPGGLHAIADAAEVSSTGGRIHLTTRQNFQIYDVVLEHVPKLLEHLARAGVTSREASGNTVRNVVGCPFAGICPREHVDIRPYVDGLTRHFLRNPLNQNLPRKFKIGISGCEADCAQALIQDVGIVAMREDGGQFGFRLLAGGGLGQKPAEAVVVEPLLSAADLLPAVEAVVALHNRHSDRALRHGSRLKFLTQRLGTAAFIARFRDELERTRLAVPAKDRPGAEWHGGARYDEIPSPGTPLRVFKQKQPGQYAVPISVRHGELDAARLRAIAMVAERFAVPDIRVTNDQNLLLVGVPENLLTPVALGLKHPDPATDETRIVTCRGTASCSLGITAPLALAAALDEFRDLRVHVSGCPNGCAQPETADIGLAGHGRRHHGKLIPQYQLHLGGSGRFDGRLGFAGPSVPAARVGTAVRRIADAFRQERRSGEEFGAWSWRNGAAWFNALLADLTTVAPDDAAELARDVGAVTAFRVVSGTNECGQPGKKASALPLFIELARERRYRAAALAATRVDLALTSLDTSLRLLLNHEPIRSQLAETANTESNVPPDANLPATASALAARISFLQLNPAPTPVTRCAADIDELVRRVGESHREREPALDLSSLLPGNPAAPVTHGPGRPVDADELEVLP